MGEACNNPEGGTKFTVTLRAVASGAPDDAAAALARDSAYSRTLPMED